MSVLKKVIVLNSLIITALVLAAPVLAQDVAGSGDLAKVKDFIEKSITALTVLAGTISGGFFTWGGYGYITSAGNPEGLERSKRTIMYSAIGLSITTGAFVLTRIVTDLASKSGLN